MERPPNAIDLGLEHWYVWTQWAPERDINPQYEGIPDEPRYGLIVGHPRLDHPEVAHEASITIDGPVQRALEERNQQRHPDKKPTSMWTLESADPLTLSPSLLCTVRPEIVDENGWSIGCGDHGFIRKGLWMPA